MTLKPTGSTEWASDGAALRINPNSAMRNYGWTTSDNTLSGDPPKPSLQRQNGWNYNASLWAAWIDANFFNLIEDNVFQDLWAWDTGRVASVFVDPFTDEIKAGAGNVTLDWARADTGGPAPFWGSFSQDCLFGAKYLEFYDMIGRGLALKMVDASFRVWTIYNPLGKGLSDNQQTEPIATMSGQMNGSNATERSLLFSINSAADNIAILKDGVPVADFTSFDTLSEFQFNSKNPTGIRVGWFSGFSGDSAYGVSVKDLRESGRPTRRWIRPCNHSSTAVMASDTTPSIQFAFDFEPGISYRYDFDLLIDSQVSLNDAWQIECSINVATVIAKSYVSGANMIKVAGGFMMPPEIVEANVPAMKFVGLTRAVNGQSRSGDVSGLYNFGNHLGSMLWVSERY